ncbi:hypothetical protein MASR2M47_15340 [Draconibacterium sp.]
MIQFSCSNVNKKNSDKAGVVLNKESDIMEIRIVPTDGINIRKGPGANFALDESGQLVKGEKLYVLEEKNDWIRFRVTSNDVGWTGWVKKDLTINESQSKNSNQENNIKTLKESGLLYSVNPQLNEAYVNSVIWNQLQYQNKENIGKILAFYCGQKKGTNLNWVEIKDSNSGKILAKYSESWGFKGY